MFRSLRVRILGMMLLVVSVALATVLISANIATRNQFSKFVEEDRFVRGEIIQDGLLDFFLSIEAPMFDRPVNRTSPFRILDNAPIFPFGMFVIDVSDLYPIPQPFLSRSGVFTTYSTPLGGEGVSIENLNFEELPNGEVLVSVGGEELASFAIEPFDIASRPVRSGFLDGISQTFLISGAIAGLSAIVVTLLLSRMILRPVNALKSAVQRIQGGDLTQRVTIPAQGEIGELADAFNRMAQTLQRNEQLRQNMVSDIAHELRTPITNIRGYLEALDDGVMQADKQTIHLIHEEAVLLTRLTQDLQELALADAGTLQIDKQAMSMEQVIQQTIQQHQPRAKDKQIRFVTHIQKNMPDIHADPNRIAQVLHNLLSNAVYYTPEKGTITLSASVEDELMTVQVADTGKGIAPEHLENIFERFYRSDPSRNRSTGGAGLGLAIVKQLIEAHDGKVSVESEKDKGTTFTFALPLNSQKLTDNK